MDNGVSDLGDYMLLKYIEADWRVHREKELLLSKTEIVCQVQGPQLAGNSYMGVHCGVNSTSLYIFMTSVVLPQNSSSCMCFSNTTL